MTTTDDDDLNELLTALKEGKPLPAGTIFHACGPGNAECKCQCPDGPCEHKWDGKWQEGDGDNGSTWGSASCSRCGMTAMDHDEWLF